MKSVVFASLSRMLFTKNLIIIPICFSFAMVGLCGEIIVNYL